jgi:hypothetical protein
MTPDDAARPNVHRLTEKLAPLVSAAVVAQAMGDQVTWELSTALVPTQQGVAYQMLLFLEIPSAVIGMTEQNITIMPATTQHTQEGITETVRKTLEMLRNRRSSALASANGRPANGKGLLAP